MRIVFLSLLILVFALCANGQTPTAIEITHRNNFEKMSFQVTLDKQSYLPLETIFAIFEFSNRTNSSLETYEPVFLRETKIKYVFNGVAGEIDPLDYAGMPGFRPAGSMLPGKSIVEEKMLTQTVGWELVRPGIYDLEFVLHDSSNSAFIKAPRIKLEIKNPKGINKKAFDFINEHRDFFGLSTWAILTDEQQKIMETFVNRFGNSVYGENAQWLLADSYLSEQKFDKAQLLFKRLRNSPHRIVSDEARQSLSEIERQKAKLKRSNAQNRN
jgi:hypothetical protein